MIKRLSALILSSIVAALAFSETIQGTMVVGSEGELPQGLFAKAQGYLPGDIISITNASTGEVVQLLNLGTLDGSGNVAMVISPESGRLLNMKSGDSSPVTLDERSGSYDQRAKGSAAVSKAGSAKTFEEPKVTESESALESESVIEPLEEEPLKEEPLEEISQEPYEEEPVFEDEGTEDFETSKEGVEAPSPLDEVEPQKEYEAVEEDELPEEERGEAFTDEEAPFTDEPLLNTEEPLDEGASDESALDEAGEEVQNVEPEEALSYEAFTPDELSEIEEEPRPVEEDDLESFTPDALSEDAAEEDIPSDLPGEEVLSNEPSKDEAFSDETLPLVDESPSDDEPVAEFTIEDDEVPEDLSGEAVASVEPERVPEEDLSGEEVLNAEPIKVVLVPVKSDELETEPEADLEGEDVISKEPVLAPQSDLIGEAVDSNEPEVSLDAYQGIVLVPASPLPPVQPEEEETAEEPSKKAEPVKEDAPSVSYEEDFALTKESDLVKGAYYIQIAAYSKKENVRETLKKYARYPLCVVDNGSGIYKILVGPLTDDEYGATFRRFKSFGFKDAFLKKIK